jgi:hypothetical protein
VWQRLGINYFQNQVLYGQFDAQYTQLSGEQNCVLLFVETGYGGNWFSLYSARLALRHRLVSTLATYFKSVQGRALSIDVIE